jgi:hypothetical protein
LNKNIFPKIKNLSQLTVKAAEKHKNNDISRFEKKRK